MARTREERKLTTILAADVVGYSKLMHADEQATLSALKAVRRKDIDPRIAQRRGRTIKLMGDGSLVEFFSVVDAVSCAVDIQTTLAAKNANLPQDKQIWLRIGINVGDIIVDGDDIYGDGVNVAARIEGLAETGGICISRTVFDHVGDKLDLTFTPLGPQDVKNISTPVDVYKIELDERAQSFTTHLPAPLPQEPKETPSRGLHYGWAVAGALIIFVMAAGMVLFRSSSSGPPVIAVLPFHDVSPEDQRGLLSDPLSDGILANLARYPELTVIARGSSFRFRDGDRDLREIGAQLEADYIVEGSLNFDGDRMSVNTALVDVDDNAQVWSDQITADIDDLMTVIADIGQRVAYQVEDYVGQQSVADPGPFKADALLMTLKARRTTMRGLSKENNDAVIAMNQQTVDQYPDEAWGHLAMAFALRTKVRFGWADDPQATLAAAVKHGETAVRLAPDNYSAYFALGRVRMQQGDQDRAIEALETALKLNPSSADSLNALAQAHFYQGENEQALDILDKSARIDPLPSFVHSWMKAWVLWQEERCEEADEAFTKIASPPAAAQKLASVIETCLGNSDAAERALRTYLDATPDWTLAKEIALQKDVWTYQPGRQRWLDDLDKAGLPDK